jgi:PAS domain S-box-containing protein
MSDAPPREGLEPTAELLAAISANVADGLYVVDASERITYANPAAVALLGYDSERELLGRPSHATIHYLRPDGSRPSAESCPLLTPLQTGTTIHVEDDWFVRRDGSFVPVAYSTAPLGLADGRGAVVAFRDITTRRRLEEAFREAAAERATAVAVAASRARLSDAADAARRQIERDLHDGAQQQFVAIALQLGLVRALLESDPEQARAALEQAQRDLQEALGELRELAQGIHPAILRERGLEAAIRTLARRSTLDVDVRFSELPPLQETLESTLYFVASEALANASRHAHATIAEVRADLLDDGRIRLRIRDNGNGALDSSRGTGLTGLGDRVEALGGEFTATTPSTGGVIVQAVVPMPG